MNPSFNGAAAYVVGSSHIDKKIPCQDFAQWQLINDKTAIAVLSDGAGSAKLSEKGSEAVCGVACDFFTKNSIWGLTDQNVNFLLLGHIQTKLNDLSRSLTCNVKDLSATLLIVVAQELKDSVEYKIFHLGDGVAACLPNESARPHTLSTPDNGEFANETYFVTSSSAKKKLNIITQRTPWGSGFILMSDGSGASLYKKRTESLAPACSDMLEWLVENDSNVVSEALDHNLKEFISKKTGDDCSLALLKHIPPIISKEAIVEENDASESKLAILHSKDETPLPPPTIEQPLPPLELSFFLSFLLIMTVDIFLLVFVF